MNKDTKFELLGRLVAQAAMIHDQMDDVIDMREQYTNRGIVGACESFEEQLTKLLEGVRALNTLCANGLVE